MKSTIITKSVGYFIINLSLVFNSLCFLKLNLNMNINNNIKNQSQYFIENFIENNFYANLDVGEPRQNVKFFLNSSHYCNVLSTNNFDNKTSQTYIETTKYYKGLIYAHDFVYINSYLNINKSNDKEIIEENKVNFTFAYVSEEIKNNRDFNIDWKYSFLSLGIIPKYSNKKCNSLIVNLKDQYEKSNKLITSYNWFMDYNNLIPNKANIIIGMDPSLYYKKSDEILKYQVNTEQGYDDLQLNGVSYILKCNEIYFMSNNTEKIKLNTEFNQLKFCVHCNLIFSTGIYYVFIKSEFFEEFLDRDECKTDLLMEKYKIFTCGNKNINNKDLMEKLKSKFPPLHFVHNELNETFTLEFEDVFKEINGVIYFLVIFNKEDLLYWKLGNIFLKKYLFSFNPVDKTITYYKILKDEKSEKGIFISIKVIIVLVILVLIMLVLVAFCVRRYVYKNINKNKKIKANELEENYDYETKYSNIKNVGLIDKN